jgi:hypothetical protein
MKSRIYKSVLAVAALCFAFAACDDQIDPVVQELNTSRVFSPVGLEVRVRNQTTVELNWSARKEVDYYVVEFSEDEQFSSIYRSVQVTAADLPLQEVLQGETLYSIRVKGVKNGVADSKWTTTSVTTGAEQIFLTSVDGDIQATEATLRWPEGSEVTHLVINPGGTERPISDEEKVSGIAVISGLTGETVYTVLLKNDAKTRGTKSFTTLIDVGDALRVYPEDDLSVVIANAAAGDVLVLYPGDYTAFSGTIVIDKNISIRGLYPYDKPKVHVSFELTDGVQDVRVQDLEMVGDGSILNAFNFTTSGTEYGALVVENCLIHDYTRALFGGTGMASTIQTLSINNSFVYDIVSDGGDFIDFRVGYVANLNITNSTFSNCAPARDFVRLDNSAGTFPGRVSTVKIENCTLYGVANVNNRRILYVRFADNSLTVRNTIIVATEGTYTNQASTSQPVCSKNNYFNAPGFHTAGYVANVKIDESGNFTTLDPGFVNPAGRDFTVTNQTILDGGIGDPRWLP